jgi:SAM-dependent methyltransferase
VQEFRTERYVALNHRRLEFLASLFLPIAGRSVLEVGAGIGDHTSFFLDRNCTVTSTDARAENVELIRRRFPTVATEVLDIEAADFTSASEFDIVYAFGILYHLRDPATGLAHMARSCRSLLLVETCVSYGWETLLHSCPEDVANATQAVTGLGCRPTRPWVHAEMRKHFAHVYAPRSQPWHEEFPLDWTQPPADPQLLTRAIFIGSRLHITHPELVETLPLKQIRR